MSHDSIDSTLFSHARDGVDSAEPYTSMTASLTFSDDGTTDAHTKPTL